MKQRTLALLSENKSVLPQSVIWHLTDMGGICNIEEIGNMYIMALSDSTEYDIEHNNDVSFISCLGAKLDWYEVMEKYGEVDIVVDLDF
jgi:hypothetical protein